MVKQADDDVPHDRTPLLDQGFLIADPGFTPASCPWENGFVGPPKGFRQVSVVQFRDAPDVSGNGSNSGTKRPRHRKVARPCSSDL
jgi:hypothetical protein